VGLESKEVHMKPAYEGNRFEALKVQYETQASLLRYLTDVDLRIFTGYISMQIVFGGWLSQSHTRNLAVGLGLSIIDFTLSGVAAWLLHNNLRRRKEVAATVWNLNKALGYREEDIYLEGEPLNTPSEFRPWWWGYFAGIAAGWVGVLAIIWGG
jgi:hypothetical protein